MPVSTPLVLAPSWAKEPPQACRKPSTQEITRQGCAGAGSSQIPVHHRSGGHSGCKASGRLQHSTGGTGPAPLHSPWVTAAVRTPKPSSAQCPPGTAPFSLPPPPGHSEEARPGYPSLFQHHTRLGDADMPPAPALLPPAVPRHRAAPRVGLCNAPVLPLLHMGELAAS